jgi:hypothetical protein
LGELETAGEWIRTFAITPTRTNWSPTSTIACWSFWHQEIMPAGLVDEPDPLDLMRPFPADLMRMWAISTRVNKPALTPPGRMANLHSRLSAVRA